MITGQPLRFNLSIFPEEDPAIYSQLLPLSSNERGRRIRSLIRAGVAAEVGQYVAPRMDTNSPSAAITGGDGGLLGLEGLDPRDFKFGGEAS